MWFESRVTALLIALASLAMGACGGGRQAPVTQPSPPGAGASGSPVQVTALTPAPADSPVQPAGVRVSGMIATPDRRQLVSGAVIMTPEGAGRAAVPAEDVTILPDGSFAFGNIPPGLYQIRARAQAEGGEAFLFALYRISVAGQDMREVRLTLLPGATITGTVGTEARNPRPSTFAGLRVRAPFADGSSFGDALTGESVADGSFAIRGVMSGHHVLTIEGLAHPWVLKSVTHRGQDITDSGLAIDSGQRLDDVRITITDRASEVSGTVRDAAGDVAAGASVLIIPLTAQFRTPASRRLGRTVTDAAGRYSYRGLPPGEYRVAATSDLDDSDAYRADILRHLSEAGLPLSLDGPTARVIDLRLTPTSAFRRTASR